MTPTTSLSSSPDYFDVVLNTPLTPPSWAAECPVREGEKDDIQWSAELASRSVGGSLNE
jgi:hypothetical protein